MPPNINSSSRSSRSFRRSPRLNPTLTLATTAKKRRRKSSRGHTSSIQELAGLIVEGQKVVFVTGAGLSVASGVRPFRSSATSKFNASLPPAGLWNDVIWSTARRKAFRKDPVAWYNDFWIPHFVQDAPPQGYRPNAGHSALEQILRKFGNVRQITQNIDGLQPPQDNLIQAHGHLGLYKCCPDDDSDTDSDSDEESERRVHLGHRRKSRHMRVQQQSMKSCPYQYLKSLTPSQLEPASVRSVLQHNSRRRRCNRTEDDELVKALDQAPTCPACGGPVMPQALLFDEGYHAHSFYEFERMEEWLAEADCLVFCGTSFAVRLCQVALDHARDYGLPVYNFNLHDVLESTARLDVANILGPAHETLPQLVTACRQQQAAGEQQQQVKQNAQEG